MSKILNKTVVSNQITGLRPKVKQAMVHLAHHLTREAAKFANRKGNKAEKFHKRAETFRSEVALIKEIKPDDVSRFALLMDFAERDKLLNDVTYPLIKKVIVKLATHKSVVTHLNSFRAQYPDWQSKVPHLLETLGILARHKKKVKKEQEKQQRKLARKQARVGESQQEEGLVKKTISKADKKVTQKDSSKGDSESDSQQCDKESENDSFRSDKSLSDEEGNSDNNESMSDDSAAEIMENTGAEEVDGESSGNEEETTEKIEKSRTLGTREDKVKLTKFSKNKHDRLQDSKPASKFAEVRPLAELLQEESSKNKNERKPQSLTLPLDVETSTNNLSDTEPIEEDTFFMTGENSFLKTIAVKRQNGEGLETSGKVREGEDDDSKSDWAKGAKKLKGNRAQRRAQFLGKDMKKKKPRDTRPFDRNMPYNKDHRNNGSFNKANGSFNKFSKMHDKKSFNRGEKEFPNKSDKFSHKEDKFSPNNKEVTSGEKLHPSWEAKKKQKVSLDNFQGKKIKFDD